MLDKKVEAALNKQINHEQSNSHAYGAVAEFFKDHYFHGFAQWMEKQVRDEQGHAQRFIQYVNARTGKVTLGALQAPKTDFPSCAAAAKAVLELERTTTAMIHDLYRLAAKQDDLATQAMLKWFIDEQVEEEDWATELATMIEAVESKSLGGMFALDHRWGHKAQEAGK
jgi:ferritin